MGHMTKGMWALWSRGTHPTPYAQWQECTEENKQQNFEELIHLFIKWAREGQHVRLEWVPANVFESLGIQGPTLNECPQCGLADKNDQRTGCRMIAHEWHNQHLASWPMEKVPECPRCGSGAKPLRLAYCRAAGSHKWHDE